ncbi:MAG: CHASE domain-containing protein [Burkholderiales bacterium]|nr:CHASE domain-containing protein [Burkholderiales bacterium]
MRLPSVTAAPLRQTLRQGLITWLAYTLSGLVAMTLAAPGSPVSQLYLAAGVGLGLVMGWGPAMLVAVGLGGATVIVLAHTIMHSPIGVGVILAQALICGSGAALQVWVACRLALGRHWPHDLMLDRPMQIGSFLLRAGPIASVTNALISVPSMVALGILPADAAFKSAIGWWAGDTLGVMIGMPIMLTLVARPQLLWQARQKVVGIPLAIATVLLSLSIHHVQNWELERETAVFERDVASTTKEVTLRLTGYLHALEALNGVYVASDDVNRREFAQAAHYWLNTLQGLQALGWEERVSAAQLPAFEAQQRAEGVHQYQVFDRVPGSSEHRKPSGPEVVAMRFVEPSATNERAMGLNILSTDVTRQAYEQAVATGHATATRGFKLAQEIGHQLGVVVYHPVFLPIRPHGAQATPTPPEVKGTLFATLRMDDTMRAMLQNMPSYLSACIVEGTGAQAVTLGGSPDCQSSAWLTQTTLHRRLVPLAFAGAQWNLVVWSTQPVPIVGRGTGSWLLAVGGSAFAAALGAMLLVISGHTRKTEAAAQEAQDQRQTAEAANRAKSEFLSRMSHELRTPLNAVLGFAQVMELDSHAPLPAPQQQRLRQIQQAGWHLLDMIDDVLDISRIETGSLRLATEPVAVGHAIDQICTQVKDQAANLGIELIWPHDVPSDWGVQADPGRLRQILHTLLDNGVAYNQRQGSVSVSVSRQQAADGSARMVITVKDTGMGMSADQVSQLFQPFNRLGREKQVPDGAGVGLAISRHLATLMGGELEAASREGLGATFTLTLPATVIEIPKTTPARPDPGPLSVPPESPRHVLYVEDNLVNSEVVRAALEDRPWIHLTVAPTIEQGLSVLHNRLQGPRPNLILLDVHLPDASGQEFLRLVKANPDTSNIPVIMISADAMPEQIEAALSAGAACYLTKPVQLAALLTQVDELLKQAEA